MRTHLLTSSLALFVALNFLSPVTAGKIGEEGEQQKSNAKSLTKAAFKMLSTSKDETKASSSSSTATESDDIALGDKDLKEPQSPKSDELDQDAVLAEVLENIAAVDKTLDQQRKIDELLETTHDEDDSLFDGSHERKKALRKAKQERQQKQSEQNKDVLDELQKTLSRLEDLDKPLDEDLLSNLLFEPEVKQSDEEQVASKPQVHEAPPHRSRSHTEDELALDMSLFVQPKTWWETLINLSPERKNELEALQEEEKLLAAQMALEKGKVKIAAGPGSKEIQDILLDDAVKKTAMEQLKKRRKLARRMVEDAQFRKFISANQAEKAKRRIAAAEVAANQNVEAAPQPIGWWWQLLGYTDEAPTNQSSPLDADDDNDNQLVRLSDDQQQLTTEQWLFDLLDVDQASKDLTTSRIDVLKPDPTPEDFEYEYSDAEHEGYTKNVAHFLDQKTPIHQWDTATGIWFARHGATRKFILQPVEDPLSKASTNTDDELPLRKRESSAVIFISAREFTLQEVKDVFSKQIRQYQQDNTFILNWASHVWKYLELHHDDGELPLMESHGYLDLEKDMQTARRVEALLQAHVPGHKWDQSTWDWFETYGSTQTYRGFKASDYYPSLKTNRVVPSSMVRYLQDQIPPNRWDQGTWNWFKEHSLNRNIAGIYIDASLHAALQEQRKTGQCLDPRSAGRHAQELTNALCFSRTFSSQENQEYTHYVEDTLISEFGLDIEQWCLEDILSWKLKFTKWLMYDQEDRVFNAPGPGGRKPRPLPFHKLFESFAAGYLKEALAAFDPLETNAIQVSWAEWDPHTAYWFEHFARGKEFQLGHTKVMITPEIHRAFLRETDYFETAINLLSGNASIEEVPFDAWKWFQEAMAAGKVFSKRMAGNDFTYKTDVTTIPQLFAKAMGRYLVAETAGDQWRDDIWQWLQKEWALKASQDGDDDASEKFLIYHVVGHTSSRKLTEEQYNKLVADRMAGDD